jgi:histidinol-phosphate/aromatic aminotransferase/cobyric acid decarboxylase-like protein
VIERDRDPYNLPRAIHIDHEIMRIFQSVGLASRLSPQFSVPAGAMHFGADGAVIRQFQKMIESDRLGWASDYFFYQPDLESALSYVRQGKSVVVTRTFSKIYGLAALRLGWAYCPPAIADVLNRIRGPFNVAAPALAAGVAAIEDVAAVARARAHNDRWLPWLSKRLAALGLPLTPSVGNFVLPRFPDDPRHNADAAFAFLQSRGILARKMGGYGLPQHLRITIGTGEEMEIVAAAVAEFMAGT